MRQHTKIVSCNCRRIRFTGWDHLTDKMRNEVAKLLNCMFRYRLQLPERIRSSVAPMEDVVEVMTRCRELVLCVQFQPVLMVLGCWMIGQHSPYALMQGGAPMPRCPDWEH